MKILYTFAFILMYNFCYSQRFSVELSYKYLYAKQWDREIQTYNFSRPYLSEKQSLFMNGFKSGVNYFFKPNNSNSLGLNLAYSFFTSNAANTKFNNRFNLQFLSLGSTYRFRLFKKHENIISNLGVNVLMSELTRRINGEKLMLDETIMKAFGIGGEINFKNSYIFLKKEKINFAAILTIDYTPYFYNPKSEVVINQTKGLVYKNWSSIYSVNAGIEINLK